MILEGELTCRLDLTWLEDVHVEKWNNLRQRTRENFWGKRMKEDEERSQGKVRTQRLACTFNPGTKSLRFAATVEAN